MMKALQSIATTLCSFGILLLFANALSFANATTHSHEFVVQATPVKRLCNTHSTITVNGQYPGPTLEVNDGDTLVVNVVNKAQYNLTVHWTVRGPGRNFFGPDQVSLGPRPPL
ncbi:unnamed protein product [Ilex paraguariensis]|uniref:Plastocyanin-like domain-containing protein n=1 Tax=Ilex paraguariensis TaxID=185542 RepID=A0ABC8QWA1_9AQUA